MNLQSCILFVAVCISFVVGQTSLSVENQIRLTGFTTITCDEERDAYTFRVNNGLAVAMNYRVDLECDNSGSSNSMQLAPLAPFSRTLDTLTIKPVRGTVRNQKCTLLLVGKDIYGVESSDLAQDIIYASQTRLCGRSLFDGAFDDDDDDCAYITCITTRNWWHNGMIYWISYIAIIVLALIVFLVLVGAKYTALSKRYETPSMLGSDPEALRANLRGNIEKYIQKPFGDRYLMNVKKGVRDLSAYETFETIKRDEPRALGGNEFSDAHQELLDLANQVHPVTRDNAVQLLKGPILGKGHYVRAAKGIVQEHDGGDACASFIDSDSLRAVNEENMPQFSGVRETIEAETIDDSSNHPYLKLHGGSSMVQHDNDDDEYNNNGFLPIHEPIRVETTIHANNPQTTDDVTRGSNTELPTDSNVPDNSFDSEFI